ncbi:C-type lectin 37Da-like [Contarinia nasturtii]|uniref:C-type lectin 37Da-like n=1 Tax=Contarinia nasturtii TaxID=265458 RepID=UPI0012D45AB8|nr:C-type lectin 37Da-like [Contarinia nasturtii]
MKKYLVFALILLFTQKAIGVPASVYIDDSDEEEKVQFSNDDEKSNEIQVGAYHIFTTRVNWTQAVEQCQLKNMELISIPTKEDNQKIIKAIKKARQGAIGFWTSGNRINTNGTFYWGNEKNRKPITFTDWENGLPDNLHANVGWQEECIEIKGYHILKWNDHLCGYRLYYICESNEILGSQTNTSKTNEKSPKEKEKQISL